MANKDINRSLKNLMVEYSDEYNRVADKSWNQYVNSLNPYQTVPKKGMIYGDSNKKEFQDFAFNCREEAVQIVNDERNKITHEMMKAPSTDALNMVRLLEMNPNATKSDFDRVMQTYGDNYSVYKTVASMAGKREVAFYDKHPLESADQRCENMINSINTAMDGFKACNNGIGYSAGGYNWACDLNFPDE